MSGSALFDTFARAPLSFERGEGSWLVTDSGQRYLDFGAGIAVNSLGYSHPHLVAALLGRGGEVARAYAIEGTSRPQVAGTMASSELNAAANAMRLNIVPPFGVEST